MFKTGKFSWSANDSNDRINIVIAGDVCPRHDAEAEVLVGKSCDILKAIQPVLNAADLRIVQWETPLCDKAQPITKAGPNLMVSPGCADFLKTAGFEIALLANNHTGDQGAQGVISTLEVLKKNNIATVGAGSNNYTARIPLRLQKNGFQISLINVCEMEFGTAGGNSPGANAMDELDTLALIKAERVKNDIVLLVIHGGNEHNPLPSPRMKKLYRAFADAGASAVVNIHTHCPQGIEIYNGVPIVYAPGNFFFPRDSEFDPSNFWWSGYLPQISFGRNGAFEIEITPFVFSPNPWKIEPLHGKQRQWYLDYIDRISELLLSEGDYYYDLWCAYKYKMPLRWIDYIPAAKLIEQVNNIDAINKSPDVRHMLTCQSHRELASNCFMLIEQFKMTELIKEIPKLEKLLKANFYTV